MPLPQRAGQPQRSRMQLHPAQALLGAEKDRAVRGRRRAVWSSSANTFIARRGGYFAPTLTMRMPSRLPSLRASKTIVARRGLKPSGNATLPCIAS